MNVTASQLVVDPSTWTRPLPISTTSPKYVTITRSVATLLVPTSASATKGTLWGRGAVNLHHQVANQRMMVVVVILAVLSLHQKIIRGSIEWYGFFSWSSIYVTLSLNARIAFPGFLVKTTFQLLVSITTNFTLLLLRVKFVVRTVIGQRLIFNFYNLLLLFLNCYRLNITRRIS